MRVDVVIESFLLEGLAMEKRAALPSVPLYRKAVQMLESQGYKLTGFVPGPAAHRSAWLAERGMGPAGLEASLRAARSADEKQWLQARVEAARKGMETLPGYLKGLLTSPAEALRLAWRSKTPFSKSLAIGIPAASAAGYALMPRKEDKRSTISKSLSGAAAGALTSHLGPAPWLASVLAARKASDVLVR